MGSSDGDCYRDLRCRSPDRMAVDLGEEKVGMTVPDLTRDQKMGHARPKEPIGPRVIRVGGRDSNNCAVHLGCGRS